MITLQIDGKTIEAEAGTTLLEAALSAGIEIPHLCFDKALENGGECGLCLVQINGRDELALSCQTLIEESMAVLTQTPEIFAARKKRAKDLFAAHPAACSVCLQAGECGIQDVCFKYGPDLPVKPVELKKRELFAWIDTVSEKCIGCGKCVKFLKKAGAEPVNGDMPPVACSPFSLSGTLLDLCPAAALVKSNTKKLFRPWEMKKIKSIDVTDAVGSAIEIDAADGEIVRVRPGNEPGLNGRFISDKARFCFDGLRVNRLDRPYTRVDGRLKECSWTEAFVTIASKLEAAEPDRIAGLIGDFADCESMLALGDLMASVGAKAVDARPREMYFDLKSRQSYLFNTSFEKIAEADALLTIGANVCRQAPPVGWRLRQNPMPKMLIGPKAQDDLAYDVLGDSVSVLKEILDGKGKGAALFKNTQKPMIIVGASVCERPDAAAVMDLVYRISTKYGVIRDGWNGFNFLSEKASLLGALELGLVSEEPLKPKIKNGEFDFVYLLNEDNVSRADLGKAFVVYQGIFASCAAEAADVVLPSLAFTEKRATYVNMEGRAQSTAVVLPPFGTAREDWKILRALSEHLATATLAYDDLEAVRDYLAGENVIFYDRGDIHAAENTAFGMTGELSNDPVVVRYDTFNDELCRQSVGAVLLQEVWK